MSCRYSGWPPWRACSPAYTMSFCQIPSPAGSASGSWSGSASRWPSRLHTRIRSSVRSGRSSRLLSSGRAPATASPDPTEMIMSGTPTLGLKGGRVAGSPPRSHPPRQHGRARDPVAVEQVHHGPKRRPAPAATGDGGTLPPAEIDGELGLLAQPLPLWKAQAADPPDQQPRPFQGMRPWPPSPTTSGSARSIRARVSTATETIGRSSDRVSSRRVCVRWRRPNPSMPRSSTLVWKPWRA
jgi:hypothetical protein